MKFITCSYTTAAWVVRELGGLVPDGLKELWVPSLKETGNVTKFLRCLDVLDFLAAHGRGRTDDLSQNETKRNAWLPLSRAMPLHHVS